MTGLSFSQVPPEYLDFVWQQIEPEVRRGLRRVGSGHETGDHLHEAVRGGRMTMWAIHEGTEVHAAVIFSLRQSGSRLYVFVEMLAGRGIDAWIDELIRLLMDYRGLIGAKGLEASCRPGLARYLERKGWRRKAVVMRAPEGVEHG